MSLPTADALRQKLHEIFVHATDEGKSHIDVTAKKLHGFFDGYPGQNHRMRLCCEIMRGAKTEVDEILHPHQPPSGQGPSFEIRYKLPRPVVAETAHPPKTSSADVPVHSNAEPARSGWSMKAKINLGIISFVFWKLFPKREK